MIPSFECLPIEIHERILSLLTADSLISASKVCRLWYTLVQRIAKIQYENTVPLECVDEVRKDGKSDDENLWLQVLTHHNQQQHLLNKLLGCKMPLYSIEIDAYNKEMCYVLFGSSCFLSAANGLQMYDAESGTEPLVSVSCDGPIKQLLIIQRLKVLVAISNSFQVFAIPDDPKTICNMRKLTLASNDHSNELKKCMAASADDVYIAIQMNHTTISAYRMEMKVDEISLVFMNSFKAPHKIYNFSLWNYEVLALLETGEVFYWVITSTEHSQCGMYQEIRYRNPVWVYRGRIFCSTLTSRVLLGLWHLEVGTFYWLMGKPKKMNLLRCFNLDPLIGHVIEEVCSICLKQRLLFCGTNGGKIIVYYLSDLFFSDDELYNKATLNAEFDREPDLVIRVCDGPIEDVKVEFTENKIYIVVKTVKVQRTLACVQCILLSQVKWATEDNLLNPEQELEVKQ